ncbi:MAG: polysaccharide deacetylase family protein [Thermoanaerobaculia bacterium]
MKRPGRTALLLALMLSLPTLVQAAGSPPVSATVLTYHIVQSPNDTRMAITRESFRLQIEYLASSGYEVIPLSELMDYVAGKIDSLPPNPVVITVDDGYRSTYSEVFPVMKQFGFPFTIFIYPQFIGQGHYALTWDEIREMSNAGVDVESHTWSHAWLPHRFHEEMSADDYSAWLVHELRGSKKKIEDETGRIVRYLAYPYGTYDSTVVKALDDAGYDAGLTSNYGVVTKNADPFRINRVAVYSDTSFFAFRMHLGNVPMHLAGASPRPGGELDPDEPVIEARIRNFSRLDPSTVRMALIGTGPMASSYDPKSGHISFVVREPLPKADQQVLVWGRGRDNGKRYEGIWTFHSVSDTSSSDLSEASRGGQPMSTVPARTARLQSPEK